MQTSMLHRTTISKQAQVPACMSANWLQFSIGSDLSNYGRTPEINVGSLEGWDG
jgi:hypothetical protein